MAKLVVDARGGNDAAGTGSSKEPFKTITHALNIANADDTVAVRVGLYDERHGESFPIRMKLGVDMVGVQVIKGPHKLLVRGPDGNYYADPIVYGGSSIIIDAHGTIRFATIIGADRASFTQFIVFTMSAPPSAAGKIDKGVGIFCPSTSPGITDNHFLGDGYAGITVLGRGRPHIEGNDFNKSVGSAGPAPRFRIFNLVWCITAHGESEPAILGNDLRCSNGIDITERSKATLQENQILCEHCGVRIQNESAPVINGNTIAGHGSWGILINDEPTPLLQGNYIAENGSGGLSGGVGIYRDAQPDLGGGHRGSSGGNVLQGNADWDLLNWTANEIYALHNSWTHVDAHDIDSADIFDDEDGLMKGRVHY